MMHRLPHPLQQDLDRITAQTRALVQPERLARTENNIADLLETGIESHTLSIGETATNFSLFAANGKMVRLEDLLALGPVVLKFFRGRWCPYDMTELEAWQGLLSELRHPEHGRPALLVAISPQTPRQNAFAAGAHAKPGGLTFPILSDPGAEVAANFGVSYTVPEPDRAWYRSMLVNLPLLHGADDWRLPLPATFVLNTEGKVVYASARADHRIRPDPMEAITALNALQIMPATPATPATSTAAR